MALKRALSTGHETRHLSRVHWASRDVSIPGDAKSLSAFLCICCGLSVRSIPSSCSKAPLLLQGRRWRLASISFLFTECNLSASHSLRGSGQTHTRRAAIYKKAWHHTEVRGKQAILLSAFSGLLSLNFHCEDGLLPSLFAVPVVTLFVYLNCYFCFWKFGQACTMHWYTLKVSLFLPTAEK